MNVPQINTPVSGKPFTWSWSRLKNFETCPKRHYEVDIAKNYQEDESEHLVWGNEVHKAAELYIDKGKPLPVGMPTLQTWVDRIKDVPYDKLLVEQKLAITKDFAPAGYFDKNVWFRTKADVLGISGPVALAIDWKTGKLIEDNQQLALMAAACFANFSALQKIRTEFVWLKEGPDVSTREDFSRSDMIQMWKNIWPRIEQLEHAYNTNSYPAKPGALCRKWCVVRSCEFNGV
jgi:PD-(D/E)XK nuclease superfamily